MAIEKLSVILELITGNYKKEARDAATATGQIGTSARTASGQVGGLQGTISSSLSAFKGLAATAAAGAILKFGSDSVKAASDLEESMNAVKVVFGEAAGTITEFGEKAAVSAGLAQSEFQQMASVLGSALINAGIPLDEAAAKTIELTQRAADMASVFNTTVPDALGAMQAALRGESDPIEKYGVTLSAAAVDAEAAALGFSKVGGQFDAQAKAAARLSLIMKGTNRVAGDFANTSDSLANKSKILSARFTDLQADIGQGLIPLVVDAIDAIEPLLDVFGFLADKLNEVDDAVNEGRESPDKWAQAWAVASDIGKGAIFGVVGMLSAVFDEENRLRDNTATVTGEISDSWARMGAQFTPIIGNTITMLDRQSTSHRNVAKAADSQRTAMINLADSQADLLDPIGNVIRLQQDHAAALEHLADVQSDSESTTADLTLAALDAEQSFLRLQAAGAALTPDQVQAFSLILIEQLGMSEEQALRTLDALNLLDGWTGTATFTLRMNEIASGGSGRGNINTDILPFHSGGIVPGPRGSDQWILAQGGEGIVPLNRMGGGLSRSVVVNVQSPMNDFRSDLQYATILASVTNLVEGF